MATRNAKRLIVQKLRKTQANVLRNPSRQLRGSGVLLSSLEESSKEISKVIAGSIKKTVLEL